MRRQQIIAVSVIIVAISAFMFVSSTRDYSVLDEDVITVTAPVDGTVVPVGESVEIRVMFDPRGDYQVEPSAVGWVIKIKRDDGTVTVLDGESDTNYQQKFERIVYFTAQKAAMYTVLARLLVRETYQTDDDPATATDPNAGIPGDPAAPPMFDLVAGVGEVLYYNTAVFSAAIEVLDTDTGVSYVQAPGFELFALLLALAAIPVMRRVKKRE